MGSFLPMSIVKSSVASMDGMMFICGGQKPPNGNEDLGVTRNCYIFDPILWQLKQIASFNIPRISFPLVACGGYLYAIGSAFDEEDPDEIIETIERYSLHDNRWTIHSRLPEPIFADAAACNENSIYVYSGPNHFSQQVGRFFCFDTMKQKWKKLQTPRLERNFSRENCTLLSVEHRLILTQPGSLNLSVFDTNVEQWTNTQMKWDDLLEEPGQGCNIVVNNYPIVHENPILFYLGGYTRDILVLDEEADRQTSWSSWVTLEYDDGDIFAEVISSPNLKHDVIQPLCATVPIPSFRLETFRKQILEKHRKKFVESKTCHPWRYATKNWHH